ncbi:hypothetical protein H6Y62_11365 [Staphylococcus lugdunensis]|uniref:Uncharacterized protein n=1 Tax=Staphylococcus lugdunensis TaxID=28035 RepID=A0A133Q0W4_STALU|nr:MULTISPECIES: hypothetical protein [Staphylococcus]ADC88408.1 hypothetical protein SLGD_02321 [Staphylococcus lugdunensis HKU09-01]AMG61441.1 hypothetical protein AL499_05595 [Staphylococcus lugdunensis]AMG64613.1 hypothetical protein AL501_10310 [Staphylococcus lugdunensis]ARB78542.1 hypothetical protein A6J61_09535 [Staphylococcus lugdunensis]ARJ10075.1 hypothetical protein B7454_11890 [Staphylococcus lugdunensis]
MKNLLIFTNILLAVLFFLNQKKLKEDYKINMTNIDSEEDILERMGLHRDSEGRLIPIEELYE